MPFQLPPGPPAEPEEEFFSILDAAGADSIQTPAPSLVQPLFGLSLQQLTSLAGELGEAPFRARQLAQALYRDWVDDLDAVTTLSQALREKLRERGFAVGVSPIAKTFR